MTILVQQIAIKTGKFKRMQAVAYERLYLEGRIFMKFNVLKVCEHMQIYEYSSLQLSTLATPLHASDFFYL